VVLEDQEHLTHHLVLEDPLVPVVLADLLNLVILEDPEDLVDL
jgi:hypothetical protein